LICKGRKCAGGGKGWQKSRKYDEVFRQKKETKRSNCKTGAAIFGVVPVLAEGKSGILRAKD
jgi:hypothetical protein